MRIDYRKVLPMRGPVGGYVSPCVAEREEAMTR